MNNYNVKQYEIYTYNFGSNSGSIQGGVRPVLVIQDNEFNRHSPTTIIAPLTSVLKKQCLHSHIIIEQKYGLVKPSMIMLEQLRTVNQCELYKYIGIIDDEFIKERICNAFKKTLGIWNGIDWNNENLYILCPEYSERHMVDKSMIKPYIKCNCRKEFECLNDKGDKNENL